MKNQSLFSEKYKKFIINLSSAESVQRVVKVNLFDCCRINAIFIFCVLFWDCLMA